MAAVIIVPVTFAHAGGEDLRGQWSRLWTSPYRLGTTITSTVIRARWPLRRALG